jgi:hypothetical protein
MATNTTKLGLIKPDFVDVVDVADLNTNADDIDAAVGFALVTSSTRPATPWAGQAIFETDTDLAFVWDGTAWMPSGGGGSIEISATAPASPGEGDLWWDSDNGKLYIYYNDGTSSQWVDAAGPSVAVQSTAPTGYEGQLWLDDTDGSMYVYYTDPGGGSSSWIGAVSRSGGILQVVSTTKTDVFSSSVAATSFVAVTGLSATITPRSTSSKILVMANVSGGATTASNGAILDFRLKRGATVIGVGDAAGSRSRVTSGSYGVTSLGEALITVPGQVLDSPATTSSTTYSVDILNLSGSTQTLYVNRTPTDTDSATWRRSTSTITLIEVAG